jgi:hypothetical protein
MHVITPWFVIKVLEEERTEEGEKKKRKEKEI